VMFSAQDAIVTLTFRNVTDLACLMASISNGVTTQISSVPWATGGATMGIILAGGMLSIAGALGSAANATAGSAASPAPALGSGSAPALSSSSAPTLGSGSAPALSSSSAPTLGSGSAPALSSGSAPTLGFGSAPALSYGSVPTLGFGSAPALQVHPMSPWAGSNIPAPMSPASMHSSLPPGAAKPAFPGGGEAFALAAAGTILAAGGGTMATTTAVSSGGNTAQPHGHVETTATTSSHGPFARMDPIVLFLHFQSISSSGLLSLRYPTIYQAFTVGIFAIRRVSTNIFILQVNFAWANFILPIGVFKRTASHFRKCTPSDNNSGSEVSSLTVPSVSSNPPLANQTGIKAYATRLGIPSQDIFGITYLVFLCACGILLVVFFVFGFILQIAVWISSQERKDVWRARRFRWAEMASNNSLRIMVLALGTLATFAFYVCCIAINSRSLSNICLLAMDSALRHGSRLLPLGIRVGYHSAESRSGLLPDLVHK
jgi:hypothetical protein